MPEKTINLCVPLTREEIREVRNLAFAMSRRTSRPGELNFDRAMRKTLAACDDATKDKPVCPCDEANCPCDRIPVDIDECEAVDSLRDHLAAKRI